MHFQALKVHLDPWSVEEALINDEVFTGATATWEKLPRAETQFVRQRLLESLEAWTGTPVTKGHLTLQGRASTGALVYLATLDDTPLPAWESLAQEAKTAILQPLGEVLDMLNPLLIIA